MNLARRASDDLERNGSSPPVLLGIYCALAFVAALGGGALPSMFQLTHARIQVSVSFVAGLMLGLSILGLLPHAIHELGSLEQGVGWMLAGFLIMFFLQRFLPFHHHDVPEGSPVEPCGHTHSLAERSAHKLSWIGIAIGLSLHSLSDGAAVAAAVMSSVRYGEALGLGTALAVILHKPFSALAITTLMAAGGATKRNLFAVTALFALVTPVSALLIYLGAGELIHTHTSALGAALAFCAGTFLCIACADLLPELQFHRHDRITLSVAMLLGVAVAWLIAGFGHPEAPSDVERDVLPHEHDSHVERQ